MFFDKESYSVDDLQELISSCVEESTILEFKGPLALGVADGIKRDISKDVSAMANSAGGIIIYGIIEEDHKAKAISFVDRNVYSKEWLEHIITGNISRAIPNLKIYPVINPSNESQCAYVVKVPESNHSPHQARDKRFYKRINFGLKEMEEYEVRQQYLKTTQAQLAIHAISFEQVRDESHLGFYNFLITVQVLNNGATQVPNFKVKMHIEEDGLHHLDFIYKYCKDHSHTLLERGFEFSCNSNQTLFQGEHLDTFKLILAFKKAHWNLVRDTILRFELLYSNGKDTHEAPLYELARNPFIDDNFQVRIAN